MSISCTLCGNTVFESTDSFRIDDGKNGISIYYRCRLCDLFFLAPSLRPGCEREKERYLEHNNDPEDEGYVAYLKGFAKETLRPYLDPPARILDYGSGPVPVFADILRNYGYTVDIYDPFFAPEAASGEPEGRKYNAITAVEVVEHFFDPGTEFSALHDLLIPRGFLLIRTLLHYGDRKRFSDWWYRRDPTHVSFYSEKSFTKLANLFGFEVVSISRGRNVVLRKQGGPGER